MITTCFALWMMNITDWRGHVTNDTLKFNLPADSPLSLNISL